MFRNYIRCIYNKKQLSNKNRISLLNIIDNVKISKYNKSRQSLYTLLIR